MNWHFAQFSKIIHTTSAAVIPIYQMYQIKSSVFLNFFDFFDLTRGPPQKYSLNISEHLT